MTDIQNINLDEKVVIRNLCDWTLYFERVETPGEVKIPRQGTTRLTRAEIQAQVYKPNNLFTGTDGLGSHAKIYIEDKATRILVGFESEDEKQEQLIVNRDFVKELLAIKTDAAFKKKMEESILTQAEKFTLIAEAKALGINDLKRVKMIEKYTGLSFDQEDEK